MRTLESIGDLLTREAREQSIGTLNNLIIV
jgi:hypothetical protein